MGRDQLEDPVSIRKQKIWNLYIFLYAYKNDTMGNRIL